MAKHWLVRILLFILPLVGFLTAAVPAEAHILKTDGTIGAVLHIDPDDDPIAGSQASFFFEFKDTTNRFTPQNCECTVTIFEQNNQIYSQPLFQNNPSPTLTNASVFYTFPQEDVYEVVVTGKPDSPNAFQPFTLKFAIRVDRSANTPAAVPTASNFPLQSVAIFGSAGVLLLGIVGYSLFRSKKKRAASAAVVHNATPSNTVQKDKEQA